MNGTCIVSHNTNYTIRDKMVSQEDRNEAWMSRPYKKYSNSSNDNLSTDSNLDEEDDDSQVIRLNPIRPCLRWKDSAFQSQTMEALNQMRKNRHFCDVTLQVKIWNISVLYLYSIAIIIINDIIKFSIQILDKKIICIRYKEPNQCLTNTPSGQAFE